MATNAITEKSLMVLNKVKENKGEQITSADLAEQLDIPKRSVDGTLTGLQKRGLIVRQPATIETDDGATKAVKFIEITEKGLAYDHEAAQEADAAAKKSVKAEESEG